MQTCRCPQVNTKDKEQAPRRYEIPASYCDYMQIEYHQSCHVYILCSVSDHVTVRLSCRKFQRVPNLNSSLRLSLQLSLIHFSYHKNVIILFLKYLCNFLRIKVVLVTVSRIRRNIGYLDCGWWKDNVKYFANSVICPIFLTFIFSCEEDEMNDAYLRVPPLFSSFVSNCTDD